MSTSRVLVASFAIFFSIACDGETTLPDSGGVDSGAIDGGAIDGGAIDGGAIDSGPVIDAGASVPRTIGPAERPAALRVPTAHDGVTPLPAIVLLHGYGASGLVQAAYLGLDRAARAGGFYLVMPDGTLNASGQRFWNATPACCDFAGSGVDDVAYITSLIDELESVVPVAEGQVFLMGHSNGGFMSYRMACERSARIAGIVSLAGSDFLGDEACVPTQPVSVLQIHGDADATIAYDGVAGGYPSAPDVVQRWAVRNGCDGAETEAGAALDLDSTVAGSESEVLRYTTSCEAGAELWSIRGGGHIPTVTSHFSATMLEWMRAHARPSAP